jgi:hypothetical protein
VETALAALESGAELHNVVLRCYEEMTRLLNEARGIRRPQAMTAREFELTLTQLGLPEEPVVSLTRLFEEARSVQSLTAVAAACQEVI